MGFEDISGDGSVACAVGDEAGPDEVVEGDLVGAWGIWEEVAGGVDVGAGVGGGLEDGEGGGVAQGLVGLEAAGEGLVAGVGG